jgi:hypothetical protein
MAITLEMLKDLDLPEEAKTKIVDLSKQDEQNTVESLVETKIKERIGQLHSDYERDFEEATGIKRTSGPGGYKFIKAEAERLAKKAEKADSLQDKVKELQGKIEAGVKDEDALKDLQTKLSDSQSQLEALRSQYDEEKQSWTKEKESWQTQNFQRDVLSSLQKGLTGVTFNDSIPEPVREKFIQTELRQIMDDYVIEPVDVEGKQTFHFRDKDSNRLLGNPDDGQKPFTPETMAQYRLKDVIKGVREAGGGGSSSSPGGRNGTFVLSAKTQLEANNQIEDYLMKHKSLSKTDPAFHDEKTKIWQSSEAGNLPVK